MRLERQVRRYVFIGAALMPWVPCALAAGAAVADPGPPGITVAAGLPLGTQHVVEPVPALFPGTESAASALGAGTAPAGSLAELASVPAQPVAPLRVAAESAVRDALPAAPHAGSHGPSGPLALLSGLLVVAVMGWRKMTPGRGLVR